MCIFYNCSGGFVCVQVLGKITPNGVYLEELETEPWKYMPDVTEAALHDDVIKASQLWCCYYLSAQEGSEIIAVT